MEYFVQIDGGGEIESYIFDSLDAVNTYFRDRVMSEAAHQLLQERIDPRDIADALGLMVGGVGPEGLPIINSAMRRLGYLSAQVYPVPNGIFDRRVD